MEKYANPFSKKAKEERELKRKEGLYIKKDTKSIMNEIVARQELAMKKQIEDFESAAERLNTRVLSYEYVENMNSAFDQLVAQASALMDEKPNLFLDEDKDLILDSISNIKGIITLIEHKYCVSKKIIDTVANNYIKEKSNILHFPKEVVKDK